MWHCVTAVALNPAAHMDLILSFVCRKSEQLARCTRDIHKADEVNSVSTDTPVKALLSLLLYANIAFMILHIILLEPPVCWHNQYIDQLSLFVFLSSVWLCWLNVFQYVQDRKERGCESVRKMHVFVCRNVCGYVYVLCNRGCVYALYPSLILIFALFHNDSCFTVKHLFFCIESTKGNCDTNVLKGNKGKDGVTLSKKYFSGSYTSSSRW